MLSLIVATSANNIIGNNNQLPWHLPRDLQYFKSVTTGSPIIMGRKTYESIGKALPNRHNIIITRNEDYHLSDAEVTYSVSDAIELAKKHCAEHKIEKEIFIIGGAQIFAQSLPIADKLYLNRVLGEFAGDAYLPEINWQHWQLLSTTHHASDEKNAYAMDFEVYARK